MKKTFVNLKNAGLRPDDTYKKVIENIHKDKVCPFCPEHLTRYHKKPIIKNARYWILTENMYPYTGAKHHLLIIHKKHIGHLSEVAPTAWNELLGLVQAETKKRSVAGGTFYIRFGDTSYTGASVDHLHANIFSHDIKRKNPQPILSRIG